MVFFCLLFAVVITASALIFIQARLRPTDEVEHFSCGMKPFRNEKVSSPAYKIAFLFPMAEAVCVLLILICLSFGKNFEAIPAIAILVPISIGIIYVGRIK